MVKPFPPSPIDTLVDLACRDGVDIRPTLLRVATDLYVQKPAHTTDEETQYVELALGLIGSADASTRAAVAARLRGYKAAPDPVLRRLSALDSSAPDEVEADRLADLFFAAVPEERRRILAELGAAASDAGPPLAGAADAILRLEAAALQRQPNEFSRALEGALGIGRALAERVTRDRSGEPLVVAAKALGMKAAVLQRILLFLDPAIGHSIARVYDLADLFDRLSPSAAAQMVASWRRARPPARPQHAPVYTGDGHHDTRSRTAPRRQAAPLEADTPTGRRKIGER